MLEFNSSGFLMPDRPVLSSLEEFHRELVENYSSVERSSLFDSYRKYSDDLKSLCGGKELRQWRDSSFTTRSKLRPGDIDLVTFIDASTIIDLGDSVSRFIYPNSKDNYKGVDGYILAVYEESSEFYRLFKSDELHWRDIFDSTRRNNLGRKSPKGFLEIIY